MNDFVSVEGHSRRVFIDILRLHGMCIFGASIMWDCSCDLDTAIKRALSEGIDKHHDGAGVYFLLSEEYDMSGEVLYIGQSKNCSKRIAEHRKDKEFKRFFVAPASDEYVWQLDVVESLFIHIFRPIYNMRDAYGRMRAPMTAFEVIKAFSRGLSADDSCFNELIYCESRRKETPVQEAQRRLRDLTTAADLLSRELPKAHAALEEAKLSAR